MEEAGKVTEDVSVVKAEDVAAPEAGVPAEAPVAEAEAPVEEPAQRLLSRFSHMNVWAIAEELMGRAVRQVTVIDQGDYTILRAVPAEGPDAHLEFNLGRV